MPSFGLATWPRTAGWLGLAGCAAALLGNVVGVIANQRDGFVGETISEVAAGRWAWIQDFGLYAFALGVAALALALWRWRLGGWPWRSGAALLGLLAVVVVVIAAHDEYGDGDRGGIVIHIYLVYLIGLLFPASVGLTAGGLSHVQVGWRRFCTILVLAWTAAAPIFFLVPASWDGMWERLLAAMMLLWVGLVSGLLIRRGRPLRIA